MITREAAGHKYSTILTAPPPSQNTALNLQKMQTKKNVPSHDQYPFLHSLAYGTIASGEKWGGGGGGMWAEEGPE